MTGRLFELDGVRIYFESEGEGSSVVLVNPGALDCRIWDPQWRALAREHRTLRYDPRGWGRSDGAKGPFSHLDDLRALMDFADIPRAHLVGSSFGGSLALDFMAAFPERVASAVLVGAGGPQNGFPPPEGLSQTFGPIARAMKESFARGIDVWLEVDSRMPQEPELRALVRDNALDNESYWKIPPTWSQPLMPPVSGRLGEMRAPVLLVVGERDHAYTHGIAETLEKGIPRARRVVIADAGHLAHVDRSEEFNELLMGFVKEADKDR
jgi:pimeloyl-ACP methyl ester carboxylesterase